MKKSAFPVHALTRSPSTGLMGCTKRKCAQLGASSLACRPIIQRNSASISSERLAALMLHCFISTHWISPRRATAPPPRLSPHRQNAAYYTIFRRRVCAAVERWNGGRVEWWKSEGVREWVSEGGGRVEKWEGGDQSNNQTIKQSPPLCTSVFKLNGFLTQRRRDAGVWGSGALPQFCLSVPLSLCV